MTAPTGGIGVIGSLDASALPPDINDLRIKAGAGSSAWLAQAAKHTADAGIFSAIAASKTFLQGTISSLWQGITPIALAAKTAEGVAWIEAFVGNLTDRASIITGLVTAHDSASAAMNPAAAVYANRSAEATAEATNFMGVNSALIAALNSQYAQMWIENAMNQITYGQTSNGLVSSIVPIPPPPMLGPADHGASAAADAGTGVGSASAKGAVLGSVNQGLKASTDALSNMQSGSSSATSSMADPSSLMSAMTSSMQSAMSSGTQGFSQVGQGVSQFGQQAMSPMQSIFGQLGQMSSSGQSAFQGLGHEPMPRAMNERLLTSIGAGTQEHSFSAGAGGGAGGVRGIGGRGSLGGLTVAKGVATSEEVGKVRASTSIGAGTNSSSGIGGGGAGAHGKKQKPAEENHPHISNLEDEEIDTHFFNPYNEEMSYHNK